MANLKIPCASAPRQDALVMEGPVSDYYRLYVRSTKNGCFTSIHLTQETAMQVATLLMEWAMHGEGAK